MPFSLTSLRKQAKCLIQAPASLIVRGQHSTIQMGLESLINRRLLTPFMPNSFQNLSGKKGNGSSHRKLPQTLSHPVETCVFATVPDAFGQLEDSFCKVERISVTYETRAVLAEARGAGRARAGSHSLHRQRPERSE